jgi:hypothetical protein
MPAKGWYDILDPIKMYEAISHLDQKSFQPPSSTSYDLVQGRLDSIKGKIPEDKWLAVQKHLDQIKPR